MADIGWRRRRGSSFRTSGRRFIHNSSGQSKNPIDSDHGIYRYSVASSSRCSAAWQLRGRSRRARSRASGCGE